MLLSAAISVTCISLLSFLPTSASGQFVQPFPIKDCANNAPGLALFHCPNQPGCCSGGSSCCAGGCCPLSSWCVNVGLRNEGCCPFGDKNNCGAKVSSFSKPPCSATAGQGPKPSVQCVSAEEDWYCPPGAACGLKYNQCYEIFNLGCESSPPQVKSPTPTPTPAPAPAPTPRPSGTPSGGGGGGGGDGSRKTTTPTPTPLPSRTTSGGDGSRKTTTSSQTQSAVGGGISSQRPLGAGRVVERNVRGILGGLIAGLGLVF